MSHEISSQIIRGESKNVPTEKFNEFLKILPGEINGCKQRDIYNVDERGFLKILMRLKELSYLKGQLPWWKAF